MNKLYYVPLGCSARGYFINEITEKGWENSLLVLPSGVLKNRAFKEGAVHVKDLDELSKYLLESNGYKLFTGISLQLSKKLNYDKKKVYLISRRTQELIVEEILQKYAHDNKLDYFNILVEKKGFVKAVTSLIGQLSRSGAKMEEIDRKSVV